MSYTPVRIKVTVEVLGHTYEHEAAPNDPQFQDWGKPDLLFQELGKSRGIGENVAQALVHLADIGVRSPLSFTKRGSAGWGKAVQRPTS